MGAYSNNFGPDERESSLGHYSPPTKETSLCSVVTIVLHERAGILPVTESNTIVVGTTAKVNHNPKDLFKQIRPLTQIYSEAEITHNEASDGDDLDRSKYKLCLTISA